MRYEPNQTKQNQTKSSGLDGECRSLEKPRHLVEDFMFHFRDQEIFNRR